MVVGLKRRMVLEDGVARIGLQKGYTLLLDEADVALVWGYPWKLKEHRRTAYLRCKVDGKWVPMHRLLLAAPKGIEGDHVNGDGLDNRRANLRLATRQQNAMNQRRPRHNTSGYKGVTKARNGRWEANIEFQGKVHHLKSYPTPEAAHAAYCEAAARLHGEFARTV